MDGLAPKFLIVMAEVTCKPLALIYQKSMESSMVPKDWKKAKVTAVFKKGPRHFPGNHRPVSLTSHICKVLESIIRDVILNHLKEFNLINRSQHDFVKNSSCLTNLLEFLQVVVLINNCIDQGLSVDVIKVIYLVFKKAFDKVPHTTFTQVSGTWDYW